MANPLRQYARKFDERQLRERALIAITLLVAVGVSWWVYHVEPQAQRLAAWRVAAGL